MFSANKECKKARLRRKLVNNEINPIVDIFLTLFLMSVSISSMQNKIKIYFNTNYFYTICKVIAHNLDVFVDS